MLNNRGSFGGDGAQTTNNLGMEIPNTRGQKKDDPAQSLAFEGTFKPKTHLNNNMGHADNGGMPFGTFGGPGLNLPQERVSYDPHMSNNSSIY